MKKNTAILLISVFALGGCATGNSASGPLPPVECKQSDMTNNAIVTIKRNGWWFSKPKVEPSDVCVWDGGKVTFKIEPRISNTVAVLPDNAMNGWLIGRNASSGDFEVTVPAGTPSGDYKYWVFWHRKRAVDPRIGVRHDGAIMLPPYKPPVPVPEFPTNVIINTP